MQLSRWTLLMLALDLGGFQSEAQKSTYKIIWESCCTMDGYLDTSEINKLSEPLKGLTAFYSALAGTNCDSSTCELTTALGLGNQGSNKHKALIKRYFPNDSLAKHVVAQDCYLRPDGASTFSEYSYLTIEKSKDTVSVSFKVNFYDHGEGSTLERTDIYLFRNNKYKVLSRKMIEYSEE